MAEVIKTLDLQLLGNKAIAAILLMQSEIRGKKPDHIFLKYLSVLENEVYEMRNVNFKLLDENNKLKHAISEFESIESKFEGYIENENSNPSKEKIEEPISENNDYKWSSQPLTTKAPY